MRELAQMPLQFLKHSINHHVQRAVKITSVSRLSIPSNLLNVDHAALEKQSVPLSMKNRARCPRILETDRDKVRAKSQ